MNPEIEKLWNELVGSASTSITKIPTRSTPAPNSTEPLSKDLPLSSSPLIFPKWENNPAAALFWYDFGFPVIPLQEGSKIPAVPWDPWCQDLDQEKIKSHWERNPNHEIGYILNDVIVLDADAPESIAALEELERRHGITPKLVNKTRKGEHHIFRRAEGIIVMSDSHSTEKYPDRLDIKTGRAVGILPPSKDKAIRLYRATKKDELSEIPQAFIDDLFRHNGRTAPSQRTPPPSSDILPKVVDTKPEVLEALLSDLDPDCGYEDWLHVGMALYHETQGSDEGLAIWNRWSSKGNKYPGLKEMQAKWRSFSNNTGRPITLGTLIKMAKEAGADVAAIKGENFEPLEDEEATPVGATDKVVENALDKYSLRGMSDEMEKEVMESVYVLDQIALLGESTVIYAAPNTGKTLLTLVGLIQSIKLGRIDPNNVYYANVDDTAKGLLEKNRIAEEYGFNMLGEGRRGFKVTDLFATINDLIESDQTRGIVLVLDTLKKFTDLMEKKACREFGMIIRRFIGKGGTVISLAHTNKNPGRDGKRVHAGTSDILEDCDCAYILDVVSEDATKKVVEFTNKKKRGDVANSLAYCYSNERGNSYNELVLSVEQVDAEQVIPLKQAAKVASDAELISAIETCIKDEINTKMKLAETAAERTQISKKRMIKVIDNYTGDDPAIHQWSFKVHERGAKVFMLHERPSGQPNDPDLVTLY